MTGLVKAEVRKLFTTRLWWIMLLVMLVLIGVNLTFITAFAGVTNEASGGAAIPGRETAEWVQTAWSAGAGGSIFVMILGVVMITSEYRYQTVTGTFLTTPRRGRVIGAKLITGALAGLLFALVALVLVAAVVIPATLLSGGELSLSESRIPQVSLGILVSTSLYGLFGIGLGALVRNQIAGIVGAVVWAYVIESIFTAIPVLHPVGKWLPGGAAQALMSIDVDTGLGRPEWLPAWGGALVLIAYGLLFAVVASATTVRRDIT
ncbi:ABC transporter permease [Planotetraspora kaengkrachanensis]|uniref:ABC transporter permease n=1 Tax=Planotetraspora kaengkrachanensis TaxID=575193 RepID=A0A8J3PS48_9ACTN|nr:ABC transporter permease [Planotetraspora kaengkrachanensis]GIG80521.1 ABC transporter permease [Planotetraspora kaengkrachanensis]